ncbi:MAG: carbon-nitrogen family hydrolase [Proteobacteria bacterium]|nr:carbon-nitrogen family hydrolase [Pseudomonadota bacterium]
MRVASIQMTVVEGDKARNMERAIEKIRQVRGVDLVILPELWNIGFMSFDRYVREAEDKDGTTMQALCEMAQESGAYIHTGSFVEKDNGCYYNSSYLISSKGEILANYRKIHLFGYQSREKQILSPGDKVVVADTPIGKLGMATCYDLRFPEMFRSMVDMGAEVFLVCSAWPYPRLEHWLMLNRVRALENQSFLVSANSVGPSQGTVFVGHSMMVDPWGVIRVSGGDEEVNLQAELDLREVNETRERFPALADRLDWLNPKVG